MANAAKKHVGNWYYWLVLVGACMISFVGLGMLTNTFGLYYTPICTELGFQMGQFTLYGTIGSIVGFFFMPTAGKLLKTKNIRIVLTISFVIYILAYMSCSFYSQLWQFYVYGAVVGFVSTIAILLSVSIIINDWFEKKLGLMLGITGACSGLGGTIFNPIVSGFIANYGWRTSFIYVGIIAAICILPFTLLVFRNSPSEVGLRKYGEEENVQEAKGAASSLGHVEKKDFVHTASFVLFCIAEFCFAYIACNTSYISSHALQRGYEITTAGYIASALMFGAAVGKLLIGAMLDRLKPALCTGIFAAIGALGWLGIVFAPSSEVLIACSFAAGLGQAILLVAVMFYIKQAYGAASYADAFPLVNMAMSATMMVGIPLIGFVFDATGMYDYQMIAAAVCYAIGFVVINAALSKAGSLKRVPDVVPDAQ